MTRSTIFFIATVTAVAALASAADGPLFESAEAVRASQIAIPHPVQPLAWTTRGDVPEGVLLFAMPVTHASSYPDPHVRSVRGFPDVTGDGVAEIIAAIDDYQQPNVMCLDGSSRGTAVEVWSFRPPAHDPYSPGAPTNDQSIAVATDSDGNGYANLLVGTGGGGRAAMAVDGLDGALLWEFSTWFEPDSGWVYSATEMSDVDGDAVADVAFGAGSDNDTLYMVDGSTQPGQAAVLWSYTAPDAVRSVRNIGDLNGDGDDDVVAAITDNGQRLLFVSGDPPSAGGQVLDTYLTGTTAWSVEVMPDITGDGVNEALAVLWTSDGSAVRCVNGATGNEEWRSTTVTASAQMVDVIADVSGDGTEDIVVSANHRYVVVLSGADGSEVWRTPVGASSGDYVWSARAIDDLDGDGTIDVAAGCFNGYVYALSGDDGTLIWEFDASKGDGDRVMTVAPAGDLTGDGISEVVAGTQAFTDGDAVFVIDGASHLPFFADGFESGDTSAWDATVP